LIFLYFSEEGMPRKIWQIASTAAAAEDHGQSRASEQTNRWVGGACRAARLYRLHFCW